MLRILVSISLILLVLYNHVFYYLAFMVRQHEIHLEASLFRSNMDKLPENYFLISYEEGDVESKEKLKWVDDEEFIMDDLLYDVLKREQVNDSVYLFCERDIEEENLLTELSRYIDEFLKDKASHTGAKGGSLKSFCTDYFYPDTKITMPVSAMAEIIHAYDPVRSPERIFHEVIVPPPRIAIL